MAWPKINFSIDKEATESGSLISEELLIKAMQDFCVQRNKEEGAALLRSMNHKELGSFPICYPVGGPGVISFGTLDYDQKYEHTNASEESNVLIPRNLIGQILFKLGDSNMDINTLTIGQAKELSALFQNKELDAAVKLPIGKNVFIRTVTHYYTGRLVGASKQFLLLDQVSWIADTGRFSDALKTGVLNEVEPYPSGELWLGAGAIIDLSIWNHSLPSVQK